MSIEKYCSFFPHSRTISLDNKLVPFQINYKIDQGYGPWAFGPQFREQNVQGNLKLATEQLAFKVLFIF